MKTTLILLKIFFVLFIALMIVTAISYVECRNLPYYGGILIFWFIIETLAATLLALNIWETKYIMKMEDSSL